MLVDKFHNVRDMLGIIVGGLKLAFKKEHEQFGQIGLYQGASGKIRVFCHKADLAE